MRWLLAACIGLGLVSLTSCSETRRSPADARVAQIDSDESGPGRSPGEEHRVHPPEDQNNTAHDALGRTKSDHAAQGDENALNDGDDRGSHSSNHAVTDRQSAVHRRHSHGHSSQDHRGDDSKQIAVGDKVPNFEVTIAGKKWKFSELQKNAELTKDGVLVLTFWCSFCHSCRDVEQELDKLAKKYKGKAGVIAIDASAGETAEGVADFAEKHGLSFPIALNASGVTADIFGVRVTTTTVIVDENGVLRYCGQFADRNHRFAEAALTAVLEGEEVPVKKTRHKG